MLDTPDGPVFETGVIFLWLAERHPDLAPAPGDPARTAFLGGLLFTAGTLHPTVMMRVHSGRTGGGEVAHAAVAAIAVEDGLGPTPFSAPQA